MKTFKIALFASLFLSAAIAQAKTIEMEVNGLVCAFCAQGISKKMKTNASTQDVFVSLENRLVAVELKKDQDIKDAELKRLIKDAGYTLVSVKRTDNSVTALREKMAPKK
jgi:copper chaperone CopZ